MAQRNSDYERRPRDLYETPAWVTRIATEHLLHGINFRPSRFRVVWEPAAGTGKMADVLRAGGLSVWTSDIHDETGALDGVGDFLDTLPPNDLRGIVTNPPYKLAEEFVRAALGYTGAEQGFVAMLLRVDFDSARTRVDMFRDCPAWGTKIVLLDRIHWFDEPATAAGCEEGRRRRPNPSENHAWYIWDWRRPKDQAPEIRYARKGQ